MQNKQPIIPIEIVEQIPELEAEYAKKLQQIYFDYLIYNDKRILDLPYSISKNGMNEFYINGGTFNDFELKEPKFKYLFCENFILKNSFDCL